MYVKDVHILYYVLVGILGFIVGQLIDAISNKAILKEHFSISEYIRKIKNEFKLNYKLVVPTILIYEIFLYTKGFGTTINENLELLKYYILTPMLLIALVVDCKKQIIPNRLTLLIFEIGLVFAFIMGLSNLNALINMFLGLFVGGGIFVLITLLAGAFCGKEAMGFGDVKFMGALGICFGMSNIIVISLFSFIIGAIMSICLIVMKKKKITEYIAFGPAISIATFTLMIFDFNFITKILLLIFTLGKVI